jgi:hypothetical protein
MVALFIPIIGGYGEREKERERDRDREGVIHMGIYYI